MGHQVGLGTVALRKSEGPFEAVCEATGCGGGDDLSPLAAGLSAGSGGCIIVGAGVFEMGQLSSLVQSRHRVQTRATCRTRASRTKGRNWKPRVHLVHLQPSLLVPADTTTEIEKKSERPSALSQH